MESKIVNNEYRVMGKTYFESEDKFGVILRPDELKVGDFPPEDIFDPNQDEI